MKAYPNNYLSKLSRVFFSAILVFALICFISEPVTAQEASSQEQVTGFPEQLSKQDANTPEQPSEQVALPTGQPPEQGVNPIEKHQEQTAKSPSAEKIVEIARGGVVLNFDDADVYEVIQTIFGQVLKVNYIVDPRVKGRVTFRSIAPVAQKNVLPIMEVILRLNGIAVVEESDLYRIILINDISKEPSDVQIGRDSSSISLDGKALLQVVPVRYMQSSDLVELLKQFLSENAVMIDVPMSNQIIIADTDASVKRLLKLVEIFDNEQQKKKGPQVFVYPVQNGKAKDIATQLQQIFLGEKAVSKEIKATVSTSRTKQKNETPKQISVTSAGGTEALVSGITRIYSDETLNAIIILSTPEDYEVIKDAIVKIDLVPRQVMIEGMIAQIVLKDNLSFGLAWYINSTKFGADMTLSFNPESLNPTNFPGTGLRLVGVDSGNAVRTVISALATESKAKLLAAPHILVSDNREASIQVGQQVPIVTSETFGSTTVAPQRTIQYKDIGIILKVKPQVNDSGLVSLDISQEVSTYSTISLSAQQDDIILNKTVATTSLVVQDGHTIVIGGLIREDTSKSKSGIPLLSKIPLLGYLFGNTDNEGSRTEIIILLTPYVLKNQQDAKALSTEMIDNFTDESNGGVRKGQLIKKGGYVGKHPLEKKEIVPDE